MRKFVRTRAAPPPAPPAPPAPAPHLHQAHKTNGYANGSAGARRDDHSTLSSMYYGSGGSGSARAEQLPLWEDAEFPPERALGQRVGAVVWMRPHELSVRPTFLSPADATGEEVAGAGEGDGAAAWDVEVGALGCGPLCAAAAALALTPRLLARVAPPHSFRQGYTGAFRFRFWVFGVWREVAVDDRLPCRAGRAGRAPRLLASRARANDYLLPLLEKAYAKLYGSYAAMRSGGEDAGARALQELTGGIVQSFSLARQPRALTLQVLHSAAPRSTVIVASAAPGKDSAWRRLRSGLVAGQAYCVTGLARVRGGGDAGSALVRVRAAGRGGWRGAWARGSPEWRALPPHDQDLLDARALHPDEFWMSFPDFASSFSRLELVHVGPDDWMREPALHARRPWRAVLARRRWRRGYNAGGPPEAADTTGCNPQFHVQIPGAEKCHVVVSVTQQYSVRGRRRALRGIGFALYELPAGASSAGARRGARPLAGLRALDVTHWSRAREVATFFTLPPGEYLLVPHTRRAHTDAAFLLRVLTDQHANIWEVNEDNMILRSIASEFPDEHQPLPPEMRALLVKMLGSDEVEEVDACELRRALRRGGLGGAVRGAGGAELARALVALRDAGVCGRMPARDVPAMLRVLAGWRAALGGGGGCSRAVSSYRLRALLWAAGVAASNKVLEGCVARFAPHAALRPPAFLLALARIHLAHERYRSLDTKLKSNPLSLEEMILMTIYS